MKRMTLVLIRHGETKGNLERRYVGSTDEELTPDATKQLRNSVQLQNILTVTGKDKKNIIYTSPMKRAVMTADILFPQSEKIIIHNFRECEFGDFEYKNYAELNGNPDYQRFIDSAGESGFPKGETKQEFSQRTRKAFEEIIKNEAERENENVVIVAHGGTIMAIMDGFYKPHADYFDWQVGCGQGFIVDIIVEHEKLTLRNCRKYNV